MDAANGFAPMGVPSGASCRMLQDLTSRDHARAEEMKNQALADLDATGLAELERLKLLQKRGGPVSEFEMRSLARSTTPCTTCSGNPKCGSIPSASSAGARQARAFDGVGHHSCLERCGFAERLPGALQRSGEAAGGNHRCGCLVRARAALGRSLLFDGGAQIVHCQAPSRGAQLNAGATAATGDVLVFTHADTELLLAHLDAIVAATLDPAVLGGAFHKDLGAHYPAFRWATPIVRWWTRRFGLVYGDQSIFLRRTAFSSLGGFADIPIMEDIELTQRLRRHLDRSQFILLDPPLRTSMRRFHRRGRFLTRLGNICLVFAWRLRLLTPTQIHRWYYRAKQS